MTKDEAVLELRFCNVSEEDIAFIVDKCKHKNISPQFLDDELEKLDYERFFRFEYDEDFGAHDAYTASPANKKRNSE